METQKHENTETHTHTHTHTHTQVLTRTLYIEQILLKMYTEYLICMLIVYLVEADFTHVPPIRFMYLL